MRARDACNGDANTSDKWKAVRYEHWSSISDQLFRDLSLAAVAGIHVLEESKNKSSITEVKCPKDGKGDVDFSKASSDGSLTCDVSGDNLDKVSKLRLENAKNQVDPARPDGIVTVNGDSSTAKAVFKVSDLASLPGDTYDVFALSKDCKLRSSAALMPTFRVLPNAMIFACFNLSALTCSKNSKSFGFEPGLPASM